LVLIVNHAAIPNAIDLQDGVLNFAEFDPVTQVLDLKILAAEKHDLAAAVPEAAIARPID
jgi:hypothetical protein